jgi:hypothetical protein
MSAVRQYRPFKGSGLLISMDQGAVPIKIQKFLMRDAVEARLAIIAALAIELIWQSPNALIVAVRKDWSVRHPSPKNCPFPNIPTTASLPCSDVTVAFIRPS